MNLLLGIVQLYFLSDKQTWDSCSTQYIAYFEPKDSKNDAFCSYTRHCHPPFFPQTFFGPYVLSGGPLIFNVILFKRKAVYTEGAGPVCKCTGQCTLEECILLF